jgi:hypothetical protein
MYEATTAVLCAMLASGVDPSTEEHRTETGEATQPPRERRRNVVSLRPFAVLPHYGFDLGYERSLGRRFSVGGRFGYFVPRAGYGHLQGFEETLFTRLWIPGALHGIHAEVSLGVGHHVLVQSPKLSETSITPGLGMGGRWQLDNGLVLGASAGLRWGFVVAEEPLICTPSTPCPAVRRGVHAQLAIEIGYAF